MVGDFAVAIHLLIPQLENIIQFHIKGAGLIDLTRKCWTPSPLMLELGR